MTYKRARTHTHTRTNAHTNKQEIECRKVEFGMGAINNKKKPRTIH